MICTTPLYNNYNNVKEFIEFIEFYRILGATKFTIYLDSASTSVQQLLQYYTNQEIVRVFDWKLEESKGSIAFSFFIKYSPKSAKSITRKT